MAQGISNNDIQKVRSLVGEGTTGIRGPLPDRSSGPSFKDTLNSIDPSKGVKSPQQVQGPLPLQFSNHAIERMRSRGIAYNQAQLDRLGSAVEKAAAKGSRDALVIMDDSAMIVSVRNNKVVTVVDKNMLKENVFTNIDSTVFA